MHDGIVSDLASVAHAPVQKTIILKIDDFSKGLWMLVHLLYVSQPVGPVTSTVTSSILKTSIQKNKESDITGVLCQGVGLWMQILEGERS